MARQAHGISAYKAAMRAAPPLQAVVLLYDTALAHVARAGDAARRKDHETQFKEARRAAEVMNGLNSSLNMQAGGRVAASTREMYLAVCKALLSAVGRRSGAECYDKIFNALRIVRDSWAEIAGMAPWRGRAPSTPVGDPLGGVGH